MIFSTSLLSSDALRLPVLSGCEWFVSTEPSGASHLVLEVKGVPFSSFPLNHPSDGDYFGVIERAASSLVGDWLVEF